MVTARTVFVVALLLILAASAQTPATISQQFPTEQRLRLQGWWPTKPASVNDFTGPRKCTGCHSRIYETTRRLSVSAKDPTVTNSPGTWRERSLLPAMRVTKYQSRSAGSSAAGVREEVSFSVETTLIMRVVSATLFCCTASTSLPDNQLTFPRPLKSLSATS